MTLNRTITIIAIVIIFLAIIFYIFNYQMAAGQSQPNTETEEAQKVIGIAYALFAVCDNAQDRPSDYMNSLLLQKCDYDIKFLKGLCESTNNTEYEYCTDTTMDSYLIVRGQYDAPRPNDVWCDHFIDKCIEYLELAKEKSIQLLGDDEDNTMIEFYDDQIEKLEERKSQQ